MKTLLITLEYPPFQGGVANYYGNLVKYWPWPEEIEVIDNCQGELFSGRGPWPWFKAIIKIWQKKRNNSFNYLLVGHILPLGTAAFIASLFKPFDYAIILHGLDFTSALVSYRKKFLAKLILRRADKIICANSYLAQLVSQFDSQLTNKVVVKNPGIDLAIPDIDSDKLKEIKKKYDLDNSVNLLSLGRLVLRKGFDKVIEALNIIKDKNIKYFIIGEGPEEKNLKKMAATSSQAERIFFIGSVSEAYKWCWLYATDIFIMPSRQIGFDFEGFGIVYLEANLAGKPVIAGDSGGVKDAVVHEKTGLLVDPKNPEAIKEAILRLVYNKDLRLKLGEYGCKRSQSEFNWEKQAQQFLAIIKK
jgi:phosphatidyl-myo-inositol dimannoside synthase